MLCAPTLVSARIAWNTGEEIVDCLATAWAGNCVRVEIPERAISLARGGRRPAAIGDYLVDPDGLEPPTSAL